MSADVAISIACIVAIFVIALALGISIGHTRCTRWWQDEMIRRRHAVYHWENGQWYWNEDEPTTPKDPAATKVKKMTEYKSDRS